MNNVAILSTAASRIAASGAQAALFVTPSGSEIKRPAKMPSIKGVKGELRYVNPAIINIDSGTYQRPAITDHVRKIALSWDWGVYQPVSLAQRPDGSLWCYDGQHRLLAAKMRGDILDLPCWVIYTEGAKDEAGSWLTVNNNRRRTKPMEEFKARSVAEDPIHKWLTEFFSANGLTPCSKKNLGTGETNAVNTCVNALKRKDIAAGKDSIRQAFMLLGLIWPGEPMAFSGRAVEGMLRLLSRIEPDGVAKLVKHGKRRLGEHPIKALLDQADLLAKASGTAINAHTPNVLFDRFNFRQRTDLLENKAK